MDPHFAGFETVTHDAGDARIHARVGGEGPPLLLLHGFPQTGAMWAMIAPALARRFRVTIPDLRGYGRSRGPVGAAAASKRAMAADMVSLMRSLGHERFSLAGHDRGGRVAYRLALDHPDCVAKIAVLDILPTIEYWDKFDRAYGMTIYHWAFLAQPWPMPERLIGAQPDFWIDWTLQSWCARKDLSAFDAGALEDYRANARDPAVLRAMCDDYRAGAGVDVDHDSADRAAGRKIAAPLLALWGGTGIATAAATPLETWRKWAHHAEGRAIKGGHFLPEENPDDSLAALLEFFA